MSRLENFDGIDRGSYSVFIETGTHNGDTLEIAHNLFAIAISIEQNLTLAEAARRRFLFNSNIKILYGHSPTILREIIRGDISTVFWLDAHYCESGDTIGAEGGQCPLLDELRAILSVNWLGKPPIILIDDAYMFDDSIPHPGSKYPFWTSNESQHTCYNRADWPTIAQIDELLQVGKPGWFRKSMRSDREGEPAYILEYRV